VLNQTRGNSRVSRATAARIREISARLNYRPNHAARLLRGKRSQTFGVMVASAGDPLRSFLVQYLDAEAVAIGCRTLIVNTIGNPEVGPDQFAACIAELARRRVDGVFCAVHGWCEGDRAALAAAHPNTVFYENPGVPGAAFVAVDRAEAARLAVRHLLERGRRRIGLAIPSLDRPTSAARYRGYCGELSAHGVALDERLLYCAEGASGAPFFARHNFAAKKWDFPVESMDRVVDALVVEGRADAVAVYDDFWAAALLRRLRARGVRVPDDVAVVGYLNHYLADWTDPPLTSVDLSHAEAARRMVAMLERMIADEPLPGDEREVWIEPRLVVREST